MLTPFGRQVLKFWIWLMDLSASSLKRTLLCFFALVIMGHPGMSQSCFEVSGNTSLWAIEQAPLPSNQKEIIRYFKAFGDTVIDGDSLIFIKEARDSLKGEKFKPKELNDSLYSPFALLRYDQDCRVYGTPWLGSQYDSSEYLLMDYGLENGDTLALDFPFIDGPASSQGFRLDEKSFALSGTHQVGMKYQDEGARYYRFSPIDGDSSNHLDENLHVVSGLLNYSHPFISFEDSGSIDQLKNADLQFNVRFAQGVLPSGIIDTSFYKKPVGIEIHKSNPLYGITFFPGSFTVESKSTEVVEVIIFGINGTMIKQFKLYPEDYEKIVLNTGLYIMSISNSQNHETTKIFVH